MTKQTPTTPYPKKRMGQHFLADPRIAQAIVTASKVMPGDRVVEIGPGLGALSRPLLQQVKQLWAIELDTQLLPLLLQNTEGLGTFHVESEDALQTDYRGLAKRLGGTIHLVANLPYNLSSPLLLRFLEHREVIDSMTLMFQAEVAERIAAGPGTKAYGTLSVLCGMWMQADIIMTVPPSAFRPPPKVTSAVLRLVRRSQPLAPLNDPTTFTQVVRAAFGQRRKVLSNALKVIHPTPSKWLKTANIDPNRRGETLSITEFAHLANSME